VQHVSVQQVLRCVAFRRARGRQKSADNGRMQAVIVVVVAAYDADQFQLGRFDVRVKRRWCVFGVRWFCGGKSQSVWFA